MDLQLIDRIRGYIVGHFPSARGRAFGDEEPLLANGILDSLGVLDLVAFLEAEFRLSVGDDDLVPEHFASLRSLATFVAAKMHDDSGRAA